MSKVEEKFLEQYSFSTLRDVALSSIQNNDFIIYDSTLGKFKNIKQPRFGNDFNEITRDVVQSFTGTAWQSYSTLNFSVTGPDFLNKYRFFLNFLWRHSSIANGAQFRIVLDGVQLGSVLQIEPQDKGADQRIDGALLRYSSNLSIGSHSLQFQVKPFNSNQTTTIHQSVMEVWRVQ